VAISKIAEKIFNGENKTVCAWIASDNGLACANDQYLMHSENEFLNGNYVSIKYDPRKFPFWHTQSGFNLDGYDGLIFIFEKRLYVEIEALMYWLDTNS
jgi:hypothetical protein